MEIKKYTAREVEEQKGIYRDSKGRLLPGSKKVGGRKQGTKNKATTKMRNFVADFLELNTAGLQEDFDSLAPKEKFDVIVSLLPYVIPKQSNATIKVDAEIARIENITDGIKNINEIFGIKIEDAEAEEL